ncbi:hypothetical protein EDD36DRAFT_451041 [Exophiala viscosa]|uniref:HOOK N-terminal domain-containing protein n=1 Tax=Exophiala viscosa TaxID=2486360 RepID=A0AAN6E0L0_9EURO|nr:hypothetical protein EDD36DRAFT_451041 [Exophiala viscosa]
MATEEAIAAGLIDWVNSLSVADPISTVDDLTNGEVIWKVLQQIDRFSFPGKLPEDANTDQWIHKWTNLKHIYDALSIFLVEECGQSLRFPGGRPDLKAIAQSSSLSDAIGLLKLLVRIEYLKQMQELTESTQGAGEDDGADDEEELADGNAQENENDPPMSPRQERLGKVIADNQRIAHEKRELQKQLDEQHTRYEQLQERFDQSQDELKETGDRLTSVLAGRSDSQSLDSKHDTLVATLETRVEELRKSNEVLKIKAEKAQKLQDDFDELKIDRDRLARKANTAEKYRQKLEASQDLEKDNTSLKSKVAELQNQLKQSDSARREVDEYRRLLPSIEQERYDINEMKKRLEFDYHALEARYHDTQQEVHDLQERLRDYEDGIPSATKAERQLSPVNKDLEKEEADFAESEARLTAALLNGDSSPTPQDSTLTLPVETTSATGLGIDLSDDALMSAMRAQAQAGSATERESSLRAQKKSKNKSLLDHVQKQDQTIKDMQKQISEEQRVQKEKGSMPPPPPPKDSPAPVSDSEAQPLDEESEIERLQSHNTILQRELKLMASAWHEQNLRLASMSSATPGRSRAMGGAGEPRGFLGRQRRRVDAVAFGK